MSSTRGPFTIHAGDVGVDQLALLDELLAGQRSMLKRRHGKPLPSSEEAIREAREERAAAL